MTSHQTETAKTSKPSFSILRVVGTVFGLIFLAIVFIPNGTFQVPVILAIGWIGFLNRITHDPQPNLVGLAIGICSLIALTIGIHWVVRRIRPNWSLSQTMRCTLGSLCILTAGICLVCIGHELSWLNRSATPWFAWGGGVREAARRTQSKSNLKQVGLALWNYHDVFRRFPIGGTFAENGQARHSWMTSLLPYFDQKSLYEKINLDLPWYAAANREAFSTPVTNLMNPGIGVFMVKGYAMAHYAANDQVFNANEALTVADVTDGMSNTVFAGEAKDRFRPWGDVINWRDLRLGINVSPDGFGGPFKGGCTLLLGDGSARFVSDNISPEVLKAISTPRGDEPVPEY